MDESLPVFKKYIFVCENVREAGQACCGAEGSRLRELLKKAVDDSGLSKKVRVSRTGCQDVCAKGPNVLLMPDNVWFRHVTEKDLGAILRKAMVGL